jgi:hypothetical protein
VVCGDFNARIGRQGAESPTNSVVVLSSRSRGTLRSYASGSHEHNGLYSLANRKGPRRYTCIRTQGQSVVDYLMGPASFLKFTTQSRTTSWTIVITC